MMQDVTLNFGVSGEERKRLVKAVSAYKQIPSEYLGVPSFAFRVDEMIIDRDGVLVIEGGIEEEELEQFLQYLKEKGFQAEDDHSVIEPEEAAVVEHTMEETVAEEPTDESVVAADTMIKEVADAPEDDDETVADPGDTGTTEIATEPAADEHTVEEAVVEDPTDETVVPGTTEGIVIKEAEDAPEDDAAVPDPKDAGMEEAVDEHTVEAAVADDLESETAFGDDGKTVIETVAEKPVIMADVPVTEDTDKIVAGDMTEESVVEHTVEEDTADDPEDTGIDEDEPLLTIQIPREGFTEQSLATLQLIIKSKEHLLKKSLDTDDLSILITDERISFPWFQKNDPVSTSAYMHLVTAICDMAKRAKRVTVTNQDIESEKYAFRTWLIRLGFGGPEYKTQRAVLLQNLSGTSAFKNREAAEAFNERMKAKRATAR